MHTMTSETVAAHMQPMVAEFRQVRENMGTKADLADLGRTLGELVQVVTNQGERLTEHDRKLAVLVARLDGMKVLGQVILGALALLITVLIAVFGFLFTT